MITIRIFKTKKEAEWAKAVLESGEIKAFVTEDKFNNVPIQKFGVQARFRLKVSSEDFNRSARFLAEKLKEAKNA